MKFSRLFVAIPALLLTCGAFAQQTNIDRSGSIGLIYSKKAASEPAIGTQYYIENFTPAKVEGAKDISLVRYNAYSDQLELKVLGEINVVEPKENQLVSLVDGKAAYQYLQYTNEEGLENQGYLIVISSNPKFNIFKKERIQLIPEQHPNGGYQKYKAPQYKKVNPEYYIQVGDGQITYTEAGKKDFTKVAPGKEKEIEKFIKENKIKMSEDSDLQRLGAYISSIL
jgi:hypothetical protein